MKKLIVVCCVITVLSVLFIVGSRIAKTHWRANAMWEKCVSDLRAAGQPVTFADIEKLRPTIAPEHNGALMIENMSDVFEKLEEEDKTGILFFDSDLERIDLFTEFQSIDFNLLRTFLSSHATILKKLVVLERSRGGRTSFSYDTGINDFVEIYMPSVGFSRQAAKLLLMQTLVALRDDDLDQAIHSALLIARIANTLDGEPNLIHRLVQMANDGLFIISIEIILNSSNLDDTKVKMLQREINNRLQQKSLKSSFQLERVFFFEICNGLFSGEISGSFFSELDDPLRMSEIQFRENQIRGAEILGELVLAADKPSSILTAARYMDQQLDNKNDDPDRDQLIRLYVPSLSRAVEIHIKYIALLRCTQLALGVDQYYQQKKKFPDDLQELVPNYLESIPKDPFDDKPLRSTKTDYGFVIYSIGKNLADDGGDVGLTEKKENGPDVGFRLSKNRTLPNTP